MTGTTASLPRCGSCGGPTWMWRGSVWQYTCTGCLGRHLAAAAARADAKQQRDRERVARKLLRVIGSEPIATADRHRGGGPADTFRTAPVLDFHRKDIA